MDPKGIIALAVFAVFMVIVIIASVKGSKMQKEAAKAVADRFKAKKAFGDDDWFVTTDNKIIYHLDSKGLYKVYEIDPADIAYVMVYKDGGTPHVALYNESKKSIKCTEYFNNKNKTVNANFTAPYLNQNVYAIIKNIKSDAKLVGLYFKEPQA